MAGSDESSPNANCQTVTWHNYMELKERVGNNIGSGLEDLFRGFGNKGKVYWVYNKKQ